jgi:hypothetical protein
MVTLGIEFLGEGQAVGGTEINAEGTSLAYFRPDKDRSLPCALFCTGVAHRALFQAKLDRVLSTFTAALK